MRSLRKQVANSPKLTPGRKRLRKARAGTVKLWVKRLERALKEQGTPRAGSQVWKAKLDDTLRGEEGTAPGKHIMEGAGDVNFRETTSRNRDKVLELATPPVSKMKSKVGELQGQWERKPRVSKRKGRITRPSWRCSSGKAVHCVEPGQIKTEPRKVQD